jgi:hypothetical protein
VHPFQPWHLGRGYYGNTASYVSALRHRLIPSAEPHAFVTQKFALLRYASWMRLSDGLHYCGNIRPHPEPMCFAHFKYHAGFKEKAEVEARRREHFSGAYDYKKYLELIAEGRGSFGQPGVSERFRGSDSLKTLLPRKIP